jgi:hypothetical protein
MARLLMYYQQHIIYAQFTTASHVISKSASASLKNKSVESLLN